MKILNGLEGDHYSKLHMQMLEIQTSRNCRVLVALKCSSFIFGVNSWGMYYRFIQIDLLVSAVGCPEYDLPPYARKQEVNGSLVVTCQSSDMSWRLQCVDGSWLGIAGTCPIREQWWQEVVGVGCGGVEGWRMQCVDGSWLGIAGNCPVREKWGREVFAVFSFNHHLRCGFPSSCFYSMKCPYCGMFTGSIW